MATDFTYIECDFFVLGNLSSLAIRNGNGESCLRMLKFLQLAKPKNAATFHLEASYYRSIGERELALAFLESNNIFQMEKNRDAAIAFHLLLLFELERIGEVSRLGRIYIEENLVNEPSALKVIEIAMERAHRDIDVMREG
ncbi:hypothetical protein ABLN87_21470 [Ruegeria sp. SCPT10]|uniref:hypothetical protein n=1 Tax=Ruegeria sp. SCP10 TaxID=3141377 RepID=UPI00333AD312